jgi:hypothetical protein
MQKWRYNSTHSSPWQWLEFHHPAALPQGNCALGTRYTRLVSPTANLDALRKKTTFVPVTNRTWTARLSSPWPSHDTDPTTPAPLAHCTKRTTLYWTKRPYLLHLILYRACPKLYFKTGPYVAVLPNATANTSSALTLRSSSRNVTPSSLTHNVVTNVPNHTTSHTTNLTLTAIQPSILRVARV